MARDYARIVTAIWRKQEFRQLDSGSQRLYLLLCTQEEITAAGVLPLRMRRWSEFAADSKPQEIKTALEILDAGRFIAVDWATEEVLVRAFIRWDGGATNLKRRPLIIRQAQEIESQDLRRVLASEFVRVGLDPELLISKSIMDAPSDSHADALPDGASDALPDSLPDTLPDTAYRESPPLPNRESHPQQNSLSDSPSDVPSARSGYVLTEVSPLNHNPSRSKTGGGDARLARDSIIEEWVSSARKPPPRRVRFDLGKQIDDLLDEGIAQDDIRAGVNQWAATSWSPSTLPGVVNDVMNGKPERVKRGARPANGRLTPEEKVAGWQAMKDEP